MSWDTLYGNSLGSSRKSCHKLICLHIVSKGLWFIRYIFSASQHFFSLWKDFLPQEVGHQTHHKPATPRIQVKWWCHSYEVGAYVVYLLCRAYTAKIGRPSMALWPRLPNLVAGLLVFSWQALFPRLMAGIPERNPKWTRCASASVHGYGKLVI